LNLGVVRGRVTIPGIGEVLNLGFLARALEKDSNANILATPTLLTLDNEEARIIVGQNIPIVTGSFTAGAATGGVVNPFQTFDRRDIGLTLRVKPQVTQGGSVRLQIFQEVSSIFDRTNPSGIITNKRALESQVIVDDGQTIVLGGLISDDTQSSEERVPLLGSIPFVGQLFRYERRQRDKTNLMVFLRPMIIRDVDQAASITGDRYDYIRGVQSTTQPRSSWILPDMPPKPMPELPRPPQSAARPPEGAPPVIDLRERPDAGGSTVTPR
jgi:general secretion pathway protein D